MIKMGGHASLSKARIGKLDTTGVRSLSHDPATFFSMLHKIRQARPRSPCCGLRQVLNMFYQQEHARGTDAGATTSTPEGNDTRSKRGDRNAPPTLSPSALRAGLGSLGVPLGDEDFVTLMATTDPNRCGEVSYPSFCEALKLHEIRGEILDGGRPATPAGQQRPCSAPPAPSLTQSEGRYAGVGAVGTAAVVGGEGGGYARRRAMELAPPTDARRDLEGGVFHVNPATQGCANPNFTTTMMSISGRGTDKSTSEAYRPKRRQSPAPAPGGALTGVRAKSHGQTLLVVGDGGDRVDFRRETGAEAERQFRQGLGVKMRYSKSCRFCGVLCWSVSTSIQRADESEAMQISGDRVGIARVKNENGRVGFANRVHHSNRSTSCREPCEIRSTIYAPRVHACRCQMHPS